MSLIEKAAQRLEQLRQADASQTGKPEVTPKLVKPAVEKAANSPVVLETPNSQQQPASIQLLSAPPRPRSKQVEIDLKALAAAGLLTPSAPRTKMAEEYRLVKRPLIDNAKAKGPTAVQNGNLIMVTSALSQEGKSFTAVNLAMSMATELDTTVLLVDADVARPTVLRMLGLPQSAGLLDLLTNDSLDVSDVLLRTNIENLSVLPGGNAKEHATELLASEAMQALVEDMAKRYPDRIIIFDSPPLLLTTEARTLAAHMGQIVFVVRAEQTSHSEVKQALAAIETCDIKFLLLNQARAKSTDGYGYGYGYGHAHNHKQAA